MATLKNLSVASLGAVFIALGTVSAVQAATFYGEAKPLGNGSIRSFVELDNHGNPSEIGVTFNQGTLSLPTGDSEHDFELELSLPPEASATAFNHLSAIYRPHNYPNVPPTFGLPRLGIDFFLLSPQEQALICPHPNTNVQPAGCVGDELAQALKTPEPGIIPDGLVQGADPEAGHGVRYFDPQDLLPIAMGQKPFNSIYEYGLFNGKLSVINVESTIAFLETQPNFTSPIKIPTSYSKSGYYPTAYSVRYDAASQEYKMVFSGLTYRSVPELSPTSGLLALGAWGAVFLRKNKLQKQKIASR